MENLVFIPGYLLVLTRTKTAATFHSMEHCAPIKKMYLQKYHEKMFFPFNRDYAVLTYNYNYKKVKEKTKTLALKID